MRGWVLLPILALLAAGCAGLERMETPRPAKLMPYPFKRARSSSFAFSEAVTSFKRGEVIFHQPDSFPDANGIERSCNPDAGQIRVEWDEGRKSIGSWQSEAGSVFFEVMRDSGMRVAGDPDATFTGSERRDSARLRVSANLKSSRGNVCRDYDHSILRDNRLFAGELALDVAWTLYDPIAKKVVREFPTSGYGRVYGIESANGVQVLFLRAFAEAAQNLANSREFVTSLLDTYKSPRSREPAIGEAMAIRGVPLWHDGIDAKAARLQRGTVVVKNGEGHGSGFVVSKEGHILTARHVVDEAENVTVAFDNGVELPAKVLRSSLVRDAALLKIEAGGLTPLPVDVKRVLRPSAEVFACGAPMKVEFQSTITKGIVSALRVDDQGMREVQSDVAVQPGSSGGPLLDGNGNVVGMTLSGYSHEKVTMGLNFFAPIDQVLEVLKLDLSTEDPTK